MRNHTSNQQRLILLTFIIANNLVGYYSKIANLNQITSVSIDLIDEQGKQILLIVENLNTLFDEQLNTKQLELVGVGFKATNVGNVLDLALGYSHNIIFEIPKELKVTTTTEKGKNPTITIEGSDKQLVGQVCAKLRSLRKPEPYKGKGVKFAGEVLRRKAGKAAGK